MGSTLVNLVKVVVLQGGTGAITVGSAASGYRGLEALTDALQYSYTIQQGVDFEVGTCIYLAAGNQLIRTPEQSSNGNAPISVQIGSYVSFVARAEDFLQYVGAVDALAQELALPTGASLIGTSQTGGGAELRSQRDKNNDFVDARDYGAVIGGDASAAVNLAWSLGHKLVAVRGEYELNDQILLSAVTGCVLDLREAELTAAAGLNKSLIRLLNSTACFVIGGFLDGFSAGQTASSFGIDLNGGSLNGVIGTRIRNTKTYGIYVIGCNYGLIQQTETFECQQAGIAGDVGSDDVVGLRVIDAISHDNGLSGSGSLAGIYFEGNSTTGKYYRDLTIKGAIAYNNAGPGVAGQNWRGYSIESIHSRYNGQQGIALLAVRGGVGCNFDLRYNGQAGTSGYQDAITIDDSGVTPNSTNNSFNNLYSEGHAGNAVGERGTADYNTITNVQSVADGGTISYVGSHSNFSIGGKLMGVSGFTGSLLAGSTTSSIGYGPGSGASVTQATSKSTNVTLNTLTGRITMNAASLAAGASVSFVQTCTEVLSTDQVTIGVLDGATPLGYKIEPHAENGQITWYVENVTTGALAEALAWTYSVVRGSVS
jgi:hypothetical protein